MCKKAVCYLRVSTEEQASEGVSLDSQDEKVRAYCLLAGLDVEAVIREEGVSAGKKLSERPGGQELLSLVHKKKVRHVIALKLDRLFRDAEDALHQSKEWDRSGVALHLVDLGGQTINTSSAMGRMFFTMAAAFAEMERNLIAERTSTALTFKKNHKQVYSPTPYGFDRSGEELVENGSERSVIDRIKAWRKKGWSFGKIAERLNTLNVPGKNGGKWYGSTVNYICKNNLYVEAI